MSSPPMASVESFTLTPYHSPVEMALRRRHQHHHNNINLEMIDMSENSFNSLSADNKADELCKYVSKIVPVTNKLVETVNSLALRLAAVEETLHKMSSNDAQFPHIIEVLHITTSFSMFQSFISVTFRSYIFIKSIFNLII